MKIGIDLGGTKIAGIVLSDSGEELLRLRVATPRTGQAQDIVQAVSVLVQQLEQQADCAGASVGIGTPGAVSPHSGVMKNSNTQCLNGVALPEVLAQSLERDVRIANDANCFALSEAKDGAGEGAQVVFGVIVGTGTGGGVVVNGQVLGGANAVAGEWGHNPLPWPEPGELQQTDCYCGLQGCIETFLSGPGLANAYQRLTARTLDSHEIVKRAAAGEAEAEQVMLEYEDRMARALAHVINLLDPDVIVLGGGLSAVARLYSNVPARWQSYVFSHHVKTRLLPPVHGDDSGVRGAAWLWK